MGSGASAGIARATRDASDEEVEGVLGQFTPRERGILSKALKEPEPLNTGGAGDSAGKEECDPLDTLLDRFDQDSSGRLDGSQVSQAIDLFNALDKPDPFKATDQEDVIRKPRIGKDGKVSRKAVGAVLALFAEGPPQRLAGDIVQVFQEMCSIKSVFREWACDEQQLDIGAVNAACSIFNAWVDRAHPENQCGRTLLKNYSQDQYGMALKLPSFTKWLWEELKMLQEQVLKPFEVMLLRLKASMKIVVVSVRHAWDDFSHVSAATFGTVLATSDGLEWEKMTQAEMTERVAHRGIEFSNDGQIAAEDVLKWIRTEVIQLPHERIERVLAQLDEFYRTASKQEAYGRVMRSFQKWDIHRRGSIGQQDLAQVMSRIDQTFTQQEMDALMQGAEIQPDGMVNYMDFAKWVLAAP